MAIDGVNGEILTAEALLNMSEDDFSTLRRSTLKARIDREKGGGSVRLTCFLCGNPLFLSRSKLGKLNRWFKHDGKAPKCPWYESSGLTPDQTKALIYRGQQEGKQHRDIKNFIATWLEKDPFASAVSQEKTTIGAVLRGEWRRPDVQCKYRECRLVFEIQLSYTFLTDVIKRDDFYRAEGIFIIWVFAQFDMRRAAVADEAFFNRRNVFVMDTKAMEASREGSQLQFNGFRQNPRLMGDQIVNEWDSALVDLSNVEFPRDTMRPYFFDYESALTSVENQRTIERKGKADLAWANGVERYLDAAIELYDSDYSSDKKPMILSAVDELSKHENWRPKLVCLRSEDFFGWHSVLPVLLSIRRNRPVGYKVQSVYQVLEGAFRSSRPYGKHAFDIVYLWAIKIYNPFMNEKHVGRIKVIAIGVRDSVSKGEETHLRCSAFDAAIGLLFPEMKEKLRSTFGQKQR